MYFSHRFVEENKIIIFVPLVSIEIIAPLAGIIAFFEFRCVLDPRTGNEKMEKKLVLLILDKVRPKIKAFINSTRNDDTVVRHYNLYISPTLKR